MCYNYIGDNMDNRLTTKELGYFYKLCDQHLIEKYGTDLIGLLNLDISENKTEIIMMLLMQFNDVKQCIEKYGIYNFLYDSIEKLSKNKILRLNNEDLSITRAESKNVENLQFLLTEQQLTKIFDSLEHNMHLYEKLYKGRIWVINSSIGKQARILISPTRLFHVLGFEERIIKANMDEFKSVFPNASVMQSLMTDRKNLYAVLYNILKNEENIINAVLEGKLNHTFNFPKIEMKNYAFERMGIIEHSSGMIFYDSSIDDSVESKTSHLKSDLFLLNDFVRNYNLDFVFSGYRPYKFSKNEITKKRGDHNVKPLVPASDAETIFISEKGENSRFLVGQMSSISESAGSYHPKKFMYSISLEGDGGEGYDPIESLDDPDEFIEFSDEDKERMAKTIIDNIPYLDNDHLRELYNNLTNENPNGKRR